MRLRTVIEALLSIYLTAVAVYFVSLVLRAIWLMWVG